jgi:hypothetical protein
VGGEFLSGTALNDIVAGARALASFARVLVEPCRCSSRSLHTDCCPPDSGMGQNKAHDPRSWGSEGGAAMATRVAQGELLGPAGRSVLQ